LEDRLGSGLVIPSGDEVLELLFRGIVQFLKKLDNTSEKQLQDFISRRYVST